MASRCRFRIEHGTQPAQFDNLSLKIEPKDRGWLQGLAWPRPSLVSNPIWSKFRTDLQPVDKSNLIAINWNYLVN